MSIEKEKQTFITNELFVQFLTRACLEVCDWFMNLSPSCL